MGADLWWVPMGMFIAFVLCIPLMVAMGRFIGDLVFGKRENVKWGGRS